MKNLTASVQANGDIKIPPEIRSELGLLDGSQVAFRLADGRVFLEPLLTDTVDGLYGLFASKQDLVAELQEERRQDKW
jgi:AbrB family looped-hinge helix DNA binding protein